MLKRTLTIIDSSGNMSEIDLNQFGKTLLYMGRDESQCDIIIADPIVSKIHGTFQLEHSYLLYRDEDSSNGTYLGSAEKRKMLEKKDGYVDLYDQSIMRIGNIHEPEKMVLILYQMTDEYQMWKRQSLDKSEILIGRNSSNQIVLNHPGISKKHCAIYKKDSKMILCDLNSANGVMVNGSPVRQYRELMDKDIIQILDFQLFYSNTCIYYRALTSGISLRACDINKTVGKGRKKKKILQSVNCEIHPNEFVAIIGGSGAGKTTLMNAISGFEKEFSGNVYCNGINLIEQFQYMKNIIGFVPQQDIIYENLTLKRMLLYTAKLKMPEDTQRQEMEDRIVDISGKKAVISDLQKIGNNIDKFNEYSNCIKELQDNKENYKLDEESYAKYVKALNQCQKAITDKKAQDTFDKYNKVETARTTLINADNKYIKDRVSMYQAIDMANAESSEKKAYKENLEKINNLVAAKDKNYKAIKKAFSKMDQTVYMYIDPENVLDISIQQVDASDFPKVKLYLNIQDENTGNVPSGLDDTSFYVLKKDATANYVKQKVKAISQLNEQEALKVDMVADVSGSMSGTPLSEAQMCMANFVNSMQFDAGDQVELTSFATGVRLEQEFTGDASSLIDEINDLVTGDMTSLYDALYTAVERVATQSGARCVIAFTDGNDNYSDCSVTDVVNVANRYHVPVFIIGIGSVDTTDLYTITNQTGGEYYNINAVNSMQEIYEKIYRMEKQLYMVEFEDGTGADINDQSDIKTGYKSVKYGGECNYTYTPNVLLSAGSATLYKDGPEAVVEEYLKNFDDAVNHSDFSLISNCLQKGSPIYTEQEKYVQRDISEQLDSYELTDVSYSDENNCVISTRETYYVQVSGEALQLMTQECKYSLVKENGNWFMTSFVDINVVSRIKQ